MKMREHSKVFGEYSKECKEIMNYNNVAKKKTEENVKSAPEIGEDITFNMTPPKKHNEVDKVEETYGDNGSEKKKEKEIIQQKRRCLVQESPTYFC